MKYYTYLWLREDGTPYYVGKGKGDRAFIRKSHYVPPPPRERIILQGWPCEQDAFEAEKFLIIYYGRVDIGTGCLRNLTNGGEGVSGYVWSEETRRKTLAAWTPELRARVGERTRTLLTGTKHTPEHCRKISEAQKGRKSTPESIHKSSIARIGQKRSLESRQRMAEAQRRVWQNPIHRQKMSEAHLGQIAWNRGLSKGAA